jgi:hypothetical protein
MDTKVLLQTQAAPVDNQANANGGGGVLAPHPPKRGFGLLFPSKDLYSPKDEHLNELAKFMASPRVFINSGIPSGYTYLSQFITHDISLDSENRVPPWTTIDPPTNVRSPFFDLEPIYGEIDPKKDEPSRSRLLHGKARLKLGLTVGEGTGSLFKQFPNDLPREDASAKPIIVDERNDENLAVAQTQVAFMKFHNAIVKKVLNNVDTEAAFKEARRIAIRHYQWIVLHDFLPRIVEKEVIERVLKGHTFYFPTRENLDLPVEFSFAALRIGHSMIRSTYQWNRVFNNRPEHPKATLDQLSKFTFRGGGLDGPKNLQSAWLPNWNWFYNIDNSNTQSEFNFAGRIDTHFAESLGKFRGEPGVPFERENSLPALDLYRSRALKVPAGQEVARQILEKLMAQNSPAAMSFNILQPDQIEPLLPENLKGIFSKETPLLFYVLAEAQLKAEDERLKKIQPSGTLGDVGSNIVAETFIAMLKLDPESIVTRGWERDEFLGANGIFGMAEMLKFIASANKRFDELNPTGI